MLAIGGMMMYDETMGDAGSYIPLLIFPAASASRRVGTALKRTACASATSTGPKMTKAPNKISAGLFVYGNRRMDFSKLNFEDQFTGNGFDTNLPTGESALSNMKPYFSTAAGLCTLTPTPAAIGTWAFPPPFQTTPIFFKRS